MNTSRAQTLLAFDVGLKRTGTAIGNTISKSAQVAGQLEVKNGKFDWLKVDQLISKWQPDALIIGHPQSDDPHLNKAINRLKSHIQQQHKLSIIDWNEAYTSASANAELDGADLSQQKKVALRDQVAACLMLEAYFSSLP